MRRAVSHHDRCYLCEPPSAGRADVTFEFDDETGEVHGRARLGPGCQGAPGHAHGGSLFAILDEAMGLGCWMQGHRVMSAHVGIDYRRPVLLGTDLTIFARIERVDGRKVWTRGELRDEQGIVTEATGLFVTSDRHDWHMTPDKVP